MRVPHVMNPYPQDQAAGQGPPPVAVPRGFVRLPEPLRPATDRDLGYPGEERFVLFYYEPRGDEVVWDDGRTYGFGTGGWCAFEDRVAPVADRHGANLGSSAAAGGDALVLDRLTGAAYFAHRETAKQFLVERANGRG